MSEADNKAIFERLETTLRTGDTLFVRSRGLIAKIILAAQGSTDDKAPTHVAMVVGDHPVLVLEVVSPRVRVLPLRESLKGVELVRAFSFKDRSPEAVARMEEAIRLGCMADGSPYGYWGIFKLGCRRVFPSKPARPLFRITFGILMPLLFPLLAAFRLRDMGGRMLFALAEGFFFLYFGFRFVDDLHYNSIIVGLLLKYFWIGWVICLELCAFDYADTSALRNASLQLQAGGLAQPTTMDRP
jgi:hypothetical protein